MPGILLTTPLMVEFTLTPDALSLLDLNMNQVVEPGTFDIMVGPSSAETSSAELHVVAK
jgi:Fibronectin type III-like domain